MWLRGGGRRAGSLKSGESKANHARHHLHWGLRRPPLPKMAVPRKNTQGALWDPHPVLGTQKEDHLIGLIPLELFGAQLWVRGANPDGGRTGTRGWQGVRSPFLTYNEQEKAHQRQVDPRLPSVRPRRGGPSLLAAGRGAAGPLGFLHLDLKPPRVGVPIVLSCVAVNGVGPLPRFLPDLE